MNTHSNAMPGPALSSQASVPRTVSYTQSFYWSVRREFWENRLIYLAPLAAAAVFLVSFVVNMILLRRRMHGVWPGVLLSHVDPAIKHDALVLPFEMSAALIMGIALVVGIFYSLDALYGERRDRSILFWKSMPVSDLTTVLSKLAIPLVIIPVLSFAIAAGHAVRYAAAGQHCIGGERRKHCRTVDARVFLAFLTRPLLPHAHRSWALVCASVRAGCCWFLPPRRALHSYGPSYRPL